MHAHAREKTKAYSRERGVGDALAGKEGANAQPSKSGCSVARNGRLGFDDSLWKRLPATVLSPLGLVAAPKSSGTWSQLRVDAFF
jgi:hypothetical protein